MTGAVVNLNKARKAKVRAGDKATAAENRAKFGRTRAEREKAEQLTALDRARLEAHRRED